MLAVFVNCAAIVAGSVIGLLFAKKIPQKITDAIQLACGLVSFVMGVQMAFKYQNVVYLALALIFGGIVGTALDIDGKILKVGRFLERVFLKKPEAAASSDSSATESAAEFSAGKPQKNFAYAFLNASVLFCVGAMAIVGAIQDGVTGDYTTLAVKSVLDFIIIAVMTSSLGKGCVFSAIPIFLFEGGITLLSGLIAPLMTDLAIAYLSLIGSILIFCVGVNLVWGKMIRVANMLPAVVLAVAAAYLPFGF